MTDIETRGPAPTASGPSARRRSFSFRGREAVLVVVALGALVAAFFPDVVFGGRTLTTSSFQWGVMGDRPPYGYPERGETPPPTLLQGGPEYNNYLADPLATSAGIEPRAEKLSRIIRDLRLPVWTPNMGLGTPVSFGGFKPHRLPVLLAPSPGTWDAFLLLRLIGAGLFTYLLCRRLGLSPVGAFGAGAAYAFSGYFMLSINMPHADFAMFIPAALLAMDLAVTRPSPGTILILAVTVALGLLSDNPRTAVVLLVFTAGYGLVRALTIPTPDGAPGRRRRLVAGGVGIAAGLVLILWVVLPFLELTGGPFFAGESGSGSRPLWGLRHRAGRDLLTQVIPFLRGAPALGFDGGNTQVESYVGLGVILLAAIAVWDRRAMRPMGWFFVGAALLALAKIYGFPPVNWLGRLPILAGVKWYKYLPPVVALSVAVLAGLGVDRMVAGAWRPRQVFGSLAVAAGILGALLLANRRFLPDLPPVHLAIQLVLLGLVALSVLVVWLVSRGSRVRPRHAGIALIVVVLGELMFHTLPVKEGLLPGPVRGAFARAELQVIDRPLRYDPYTKPPFVEFLEDEPGVFRVFGLDRLLYPNTAWAFDLHDIRAFTPTANRRLTTYVRAFINPTLRARFTGALWPVGNSETEPPMVSGNPMFDLLNVKYVLSREEGSTLLDPEQFRLVHRHQDVRVYENLDAGPRAFVVHDAVAATDAEEAIRLIGEPGFDPTVTAVLEDGDAAGALDGGAPDPRDRVRILSYEDSRVEVEVSTTRPGLLVLADASYPGWRARIDGRPAEVLPADILLRSVKVPAGRHRVEFVYESTFRALGGAISAAVLGALIVLVVARAWRTRMRAGRPGRDTT